MATHFTRILLPLLLASIAVAQTSDESLGNKFIHVSGDTFFVTGDTFFRVSYSSDHLACGITVYLAKDHEQVKTIFEKVVPAVDRETKGQDLMQCTGTCSYGTDFNGATIASAMVGSQTSTPSAIIAFKDKGCTTVREGLQKVVFVIKKNGKSEVNENK